MSCVRESLQSSIPPEVLLSRSELMQEINWFDELAATWTVCGNRDALRLGGFVSEYIDSLNAATASGPSAGHADRAAKRYPPQVRKMHNAALTGTRPGGAGTGPGFLNHSGSVSSCYLCTLGQESAFAEKAGLLRALAHTPLDPTEKAAAIQAFHLDSVANWATRSSLEEIHSRSRPSFAQRTHNDASQGWSDEEDLDEGRVLRI